MYIQIKIEFRVATLTLNIQTSPKNRKPLLLRRLKEVGAIQKKISTLIDCQIPSKNERSNSAGQIKKGLVCK